MLRHLNPFTEHNFSPQDKKDKLTRYLAGHSIIKRLDPACLAEVIGEFVLETVAEGHSLYEQGATDDQFYVVEEGTVSVTSGNTGEVTRKGQGASLGDLCLLMPCPREERSVALTPCKLWVMNGALYRFVVSRFNKRQYEELRAGFTLTMGGAVRGGNTGKNDARPALTEVETDALVDSATIIRLDRAGQQVSVPPKVKALDESPDHAVHTAAGIVPSAAWPLFAVTRGAVATNAPVTGEPQHPAPLGPARSPPAGFTIARAGQLFGPGLLRKDAIDDAHEFKAQCWTAPATLIAVAREGWAMIEPHTRARLREC